ncbi:MAG: hypothetical protein MJE12_16500 [Alphaproteobacteria bacterium]|nr:hypothetical protein [Alphaproteobacteria bacterium]
MASVFRVVILGVLAAGWLVLGQASAAVLNYDEAVDGDINFDTFNLDVGVNKVAGQVSGGTSTTLPDFDLFNANIPTGSVLQSIDLTLSLGSGGNGQTASTLVASTLVPIMEGFFINLLSGPGDYTLNITSAATSFVGIGLNGFPGGMVKTTNSLLTSPPSHSQPHSRSF